MSDACCNVPPASGISYRRVLWIALSANVIMFVVEVVAAAWSGSSALAADALDFLGDSANYALSLGALAIGGAWISRVALLKGVAMLTYGAAVLGYALWRAWIGVAPEAVTMGLIGALALAVNFGVSTLLYRFREGDANMRSVWICSRNDALANVAVVAAAIGVFGTGTAWPDLVVAGVMATLAIWGGLQIISHARLELIHAA